MNLLRIFLLTALVLVVLGVGASGEIEQKWTFTYNEGYALDTVISADGEYIVVSSFCEDGNGDCNTCGLDSSDCGIMVAEGDGYVNFFTPNSATPVWSYVIEGGQNYGDAKPTSVSISKDGDRIAVGAGKLYLLNKQGELLWSQSEVEPNYNDGGYFRAKSVIITDDGEYIAVVHGSRDLYFYNQQTKVKLWSAQIGSSTGTSEGGNFQILSMAMSANGDYIAATEQDCDIHLLDNNGQTIWKYEGIQGNNSRPCVSKHIDMSADGQNIVAISANQNMMCLFHPESNVPQWCVDDISDTGVAISADGKRIVARTILGNLGVFGTASNTTLWTSELRIKDGGLDFHKSKKHPLISENGEHIVAYFYEGDSSGAPEKAYLLRGNSNLTEYEIVFSGFEGQGGLYGSAMSDYGDVFTVSGYEGGAIGLFGQVHIYDYSVNFVDDLVNLDVRPGASGVGCTEMVISNQGTTTIDVDVSVSGLGVTISPGAISVTLAPEGNITVPICALALAQSSQRIVEVSAHGWGYESNTYANQVEVFTNFTVSIDQYARLSLQAQHPWAKHCIGSTFLTNFTAVNNGNANDTVVFEITNIQELEDAGFAIRLPILQYQINAQGEKLIQITVDAENVTPGTYNIIGKISTTVEGETENRTVTATVNMTNCQGDDSDSADTESPCETGDTKISEDGCNQCVCDDGDWLCTEMVCENPKEKESSLPSVSMIPALISIGLIALFRRK